MKIKIILLDVLLILFLVFVGSFIYLGRSHKIIDVAGSEESTTEITETTTEEPTTTEKETTTEPTTTEPTTEAEHKITKVSITAIGDMLMHAGVSNRALQADGTYNYDFLFENTKEIFQNSDIAIVNNEAIMGGNELGIQTYPTFNVRTELADSEAKAGFNVFLQATNHTLDMGVNGIINNINYLETNLPDITYTGIHSSLEDTDNIRIIEKNDIKIAILNFTYDTNGNTLPNEYSYMIDYLNEGNKTRIGQLIKKAGGMSDFVIVCPHWGTEYLPLMHTEEQAKWAKYFVENGANLIIGSHPHSPEDIEWIQTENGNKGLIYYSLGNYVSLQGRVYSLMGEIAKVEITKDETENKTYISDYDVDFEITHYDGAGNTSVYLLSDYTEQLASVHGVTNITDAIYSEFNKIYPMKLSTFKMIAKNIKKNMEYTEVYTMKNK